jgi:deoxycytidylate deaminase
MSNNLSEERKQQHREAAARWRAKNSEKLKEQAQNPEKKEANAAWKRRNPEKIAASAKRWREKDREKYLASHRTRSRKHLHGVTQEEYDAKLLAQAGLCAICRLPSKRSLAVDHNHDTEAIRGLLCDLCNRGLGLLRDSPEILQQALNYLVTWRAISIPSDRTGGGHRPSFDETFLKMAEILAERSSCPEGARNAAIITVDNHIVATGYGSPAAGVGPCAECWLRKKFAETGVKDFSVCPALHAEANALLHATASVAFGVAYQTKAPCDACRQLLTEAGVTKVVTRGGEISLK